MRVYYSNEPIIEGIEQDYSHSIFLAGPTPRSREVMSWRPKAIQILEKMDYKGLVWTPEVQDGFKYDYIHQVEWEKWGLNNCTKIVFWVPRKIPEMSGHTTNVEFGRYVGSGRAIYGRPNDAEKCGYLDWMYTDVTSNKPFNDLKKILEVAIA